jgi:hypothetical protein
VAFEADPEDDERPRILGLPRAEDDPTPTHELGAVPPAE